MTANTEEVNPVNTQISDIQSVYYKEVQPGFSSWFTANSTDEATITNALAKYYSTNNKFPSWADFLAEIQKDTPNANITQIQNEFIAGYRFAIDANQNRSNIDVTQPAEPGSDYAILNASASALTNQFQTAFSYFSSNFTVDPNSTSSAAQQFEDGFVSFTARSVLLQNSSLDNQPPADQATFTNSQLASTYESIFDQFYPGASSMTSDEKQTLYTQLITQFYTQQVNQNGFFIPTEALNQWSTFLQQSAKTSVFTLQTSLASMGASKTQILDRIFQLLANMIDILQSVAAVQSDRLLMYSNWQKAYTDQISQIPIFISGQNNYPGSVTGQDGTSLRSDLNQLASQDKDKLTSERQVISDDSKAHQSAINQSTDAVTQQSNFASSILEQLSTLLSSIFR